MSKSLYRKIISELNEIEFSGRLSFHFYNEPLLDTRLEEFVSAASDLLPKAKIVLYTNGDFLDCKRASSLLEAGVHRFIVTYHDNDLVNPKRHLEDLRNSNPAAFIEQKGNELMLTNRGGALSQLGIPTEPSKTVCMAPSSMLIITLSGKVVLCYEDYFETVVLGDLKEQTIMEIWRSKIYSELRDALAKGERFRTGICQKCTNFAHIDNEERDVY